MERRQQQGVDQTAAVEFNAQVRATVECILADDALRGNLVARELRTCQSKLAGSRRTISSPTGSFPTVASPC